MSPGLAKLAATTAAADRLDTLPPWPWDPTATDPTSPRYDRAAPRTLGWHAIAWAEGWAGFPDLYAGWRGLVQPNGPRARKRFRFTQRQKTFLLWFYALDDEAQWIFLYAVRRLAKGSGKSPFAAVLALIELLAPVRLDHFDDRAPGGCVGRPVDTPLVQIAATAESQTKNTMRYVRYLAKKDSHVVDFYSLDPGRTIYYGPANQELHVITSSVTASEGAESTFVIMDELEHWKPGNSGPELASTILDNLAKSGQRALGTSNAWEPGIEAVAETDWDAWVLEQEGKVKDEGGRTLYDAVVAPPDTDMSDYDSLRQALELVYEDCDWKRPHEPDPDNPKDLRPVPGSKPDVRPIIKRVWSLQSKPDEAQRKYLNQPTAAVDAWTTPEAWHQLANLDREVTATEPVVGFFDGSKSRDATGIVGCCVSDGHVFAWDAWEPNPAHDSDDVVDVADVDLAVGEFFERFNVVGFFGDVQEWESFVKISWPEAYADRLQVMAVPSGKDPQAIAWDMRSKVYEFTVEAELVEAEIREGAFTHDGDSRLARHVANARRRPNRYGVSIGKESPDSRRKIDLCVCMIGARMVRRRLLAAPKKKTKQPGRVRGVGKR